MPVLKIKNNGVWEDLSGSTSTVDIEVDKTLTQSDMAADSKTVGNAINRINTQLTDKVSSGEFTDGMAELGDRISELSNNVHEVVPISSGGTNATNVANARTNLDIYSKSETNSQIAAAVAVIDGGEW